MNNQNPDKERLESSTFTPSPQIKLYEARHPTPDKEDRLRRSINCELAVYEHPEKPLSPEAVAYFHFQHTENNEKNEPKLKSKTVEKGPPRKKLGRGRDGDGSGGKRSVEKMPKENLEDFARKVELKSPFNSICQIRTRVGSLDTRKKNLTSKTAESTPSDKTKAKLAKMSTRMAPLDSSQVGLNLDGGGGDEVLGGNIDETFDLEDLLTSLDGVFVQQSFSLSQAVDVCLGAKSSSSMSQPTAPRSQAGGCDYRNRFGVFEKLVKKSEKKKGADSKKFKNLLLDSEETTSCAQRSLVPGQCRRFRLSIRNEYNQQRECLILNKEMQWTCCCIDRPVLNVYYVENPYEKRRIGSISANLDFRHFSFDVRDSSNRIKYYIQAPCCQPGLHCCWSAGKCSEVNFQIFEKKGSSRVVGVIERVNELGCAQTKGLCCFFGQDRFKVTFPKRAKFDSGALILSAVFMIDFRLFDRGCGSCGYC